MASLTHPLVTIGLPVYNGEAFLAEAIQSTLSQSFTDFELIISDNASSDNTRSICEHFSSQDSRIIYQRLTENLGAAYNYNRLVPQARGRYFKWSAHDDRCMPDFLSKCVLTLEKTADAVLCYPATEVIEECGRKVSVHRDGLNLLETTPHERLVSYLRKNFVRKKGMCNPVFGVIRTSALRRTRLIQDMLASDRLLLSHLALLGKFIELPDIEFQRRIHNNTSTMASSSFSDRLRWFNGSNAVGGVSNRRFNNHLRVRMTHISDLFRAISELVDDDMERRRCRTALVKLLLLDPKWFYIDLKYSMGFQMSREQILRSLRREDGQKAQDPEST